MNRLKTQKVKKVSSNVLEKRECAQDVSFSFQHLTTNSKYNLKSCDVKVKSALIDKLEELSKHNIQYWFEKGKKVGFETIPAKNIRFEPGNMNSLSKEEKVIVARFGKGEYRVIFVKIGSCPILHIIGLDLKFNAYNHGS